MEIRQPVPGYIGIDNAAAVLGVSRIKFRKLAQEIGLEVRTTPVDRRLKLISLDDVERLRERLPTGPAVFGNGATRK